MRGAARRPFRAEPRNPAIQPRDPPRPARRARASTIVRLTYTNASLFVPMLAALRTLQRRRGLRERDREAQQEIARAGCARQRRADRAAPARGALASRFDVPFGSSLAAVLPGSRHLERAQLAPEDPQSEVTAVGASPAAFGRHEHLIGLERDRRQRHRRSRGMSSREIRSTSIGRRPRGRPTARPGVRLAENTCAATPLRGAGRRAASACASRSSPALAEPAPLPPGARIELRFLPAVAVSDQRASRRRVELLDGHAGRRRGRHRDGGVVRRRRRAGSDGRVTNRRNGPGGATQLIEGPAVDGHGKCEAAPRPSRLRPPIIERRRRRRRHPSVNRRRTPGHAGPLGYAGGFGREGPALAHVPLGSVDAIEVHLVRPDAAHQDGIRKRPSVLDRRAVLDEIDGSVRIGSTTNHTGARPPPFQYFTASSHSCCGGAGSVRATPGIASPTQAIGRRRSRDWRRSMASTGAWRRLASAARACRRAGETPAPSAREYAASEVLDDVRAGHRQRNGRRATPERRRSQASAGHRQIRHRHDERQRVPAW